MLDYRKHAADYLPLFKGIKLLVLDNDGIMTTGHVHYYDNNTSVGVSYGVLDGYALARLKQVGVKVAIISGRKNKALQYRTEVLGLDQDYIYTGVANKAEFLEKVIVDLGLTAAEVAFMGDDYIDISALKVVGLPISVPNRHPMVDRYVKYITKNISGSGAVREVCDLIHIANEFDSDYSKEIISFWNDQSEVKE